VIYSQGDILLASLVFSSQAGRKLRPVMVVYDLGDDDLLVVPITSQAARSQFDIPLGQWQNSGLRLPSVVRIHKLATIEKAIVVRPLGKLDSRDSAPVTTAYDQLFKTIFPSK
jgi:mRNA interferase MazF